MGTQEHAESEIREMARALGCFTESQVQALGNYSDSTLFNLRRRGKGPDYIVFGNNIFYPIKTLSEYLQARIRERSQSASANPKDLL